MNEAAGVSFTVPTRVVVAKFALAALLALTALLMGNRPQLVIGLLAAVALAAYGLRDVVSRERLRADADGVVAVPLEAIRRDLVSASSWPVTWRFSAF